MSERRTIGQILIELGRITEDDVARALEHQRDSGGYFGEALVALGVVSQDELEWGLASQHDLPYVFPDADACDLEAAALVSAEWALANLTLPIMRVGDTIQVIVDSPLKDDPIRELRERTGLDVDLALAAPASIREVIGEVFARLATAEEEGATPVALELALGDILAGEAPRFGISVRGARALVWWESPGGVRRRPLSAGWKSELERLLAPGPTEMTSNARRADWVADVGFDDQIVSVDVHYMADESGREFAFHRKEGAPELDARFGPVPPELSGEMLALAHGGDARILIRSTSDDLARSITPHLPALLLGPTWRSVYLYAAGGAEHEAFSIHLRDGTGWAAEADALRAFRFDAATIDFTGASGDPALLRGVAGALFVLGDPSVAEPLGIRWTLDIDPGTDGDLSWSLGPFNG